MANTCLFSMKAIGTPTNLNKFEKTIQQDGNIWCGRGASLTLLNTDKKNNKESRLYDGETKWSVFSSLIDNAFKMAQQRQSGEGIWYKIDKTSNEDFFTIFQLSHLFHIKFEIWSEEPDANFIEHYVGDNGKIIKDEEFSYSNQPDNYCKFELNDN